MTAPDAATIAGKLTGAHKLLVIALSNRWIMGTGFCHASVGRDLEAMGLVESRMHHRRRQIRATPLTFAVAAHLQENPHGIA